MEKPEEIRELGEDRPGGSKLVWAWKKRFIVYYDAKQLCPYVLCYDGAVHAMFDDLPDAKEYVWEVFD